MSDYLLTIAEQISNEPSCTCTLTDRGTDTLGCELHDDHRPTGSSGAGHVAGEEERG